MWSMELIYAELVILIISRVLSTIGLFYLIRLFGYEKNHTDPMTFKELFFGCYAGLMRGAIAFGLVLKI